nr:hypothetical protein [Secundilactobacillus odoratitofui]
MLNWTLFLAIIAIWGILIVNLILTIAGYVYYLKWQREPVVTLPQRVPFVSILVPAHNEAVVLEKNRHGVIGNGLSAGPV